MLKTGSRSIVCALVVTCASLGAQTPAPVIDSALTWQTLTQLAADSMEGRRIGTRGNEAARRFIVASLTRAGVEPAAPGYLQNFEAAGRDGAAPGGTNVLGVVHGADSSRVIVVSAHFDHVGIRGGKIYNGADDNASGTAAALALAAWYAAHPPRHTIIFAFFDGEEAGLKGSRAFIAAPPVSLRRIAINVNLDMVARLDRNEMFVAGATPYPFLRAVLQSTAKAAPVKLLLGHDQPTADGLDNWIGQSDQLSFHERGIPFAYFGVENHPDYHEPTDDVERVHAGRFIAAVRTIADFVRRIDQELERTIPSRLR